MKGPGVSGRPGRIGSLAHARAEELRGVVEAVRAGEVIALMTETLWGLSADPFSRLAMERLATLKGRDGGKGFLCLVPSLDSLATLGVSVNERTMDALRRLWPSPVTVILPSARLLPASGGFSTVAVRMPAAEALLCLLRATGPLASTSANTEGDTPATTVVEVERLFGDRVAWIVGEMCSPDARPSTVVDATAQPARVLRAGAGDSAVERFIREIEGYPESP